MDWSSDLDGVLFTGSSDATGMTEFDMLLSEGEHLITLRAIDAFGVAGAASVTITVDNIPLGQLDQDSDGFCPDGIDLDGDGRCEDDEITGPGTQDCNDQAATVCPGCPEICDGFDEMGDGCPLPAAPARGPTGRGRSSLCPYGFLGDSLQNAPMAE